MECQLLIILIFLGEKRGETKRLDQPRGDGAELGVYRMQGICFEVSSAVLVHRLKLMGFGNACISFLRRGDICVMCWKMHSWLWGESR